MGKAKGITMTWGSPDWDFPDQVVVPGRFLRSYKKAGFTDEEAMAYIQEKLAERDKEVEECYGKQG